MNNQPLGSVVSYLRRVTGNPCGAEQSDAQLLRRFVEGGDEGAFALLVQRHGGMVLGVGRRLLHDVHDQEDVFQATFLALVRKAASIRKSGSLASWLYGVAYRTALKLRQKSAKTQPLPEELPAAPDEDLRWRELRPLLDQELSRLPEKYRQPIILCYLEGKTNREAAQELGCTKGTVSGRLARARDMLRKRLLRRGVTLTPALLAAFLCESEASAVPAPLLVAAANTAREVLGGSLVATGSAKVITLAEGVLHTMWLAKVKTFIGMVLAVMAVGTGVGVWSYSSLGERPGRSVTASGQSTDGAKERRKGGRRAEIQRLRAENERLRKELEEMRQRLEKALREAALQRKLAQAHAAEALRQAKESLLERERAEAERKRLFEQAKKALAQQKRAEDVEAMQKEQEAMNSFKFERLRKKLQMLVAKGLLPPSALQEFEKAKKLLGQQKLAGKKAHEEATRVRDEKAHAEIERLQKELADTRREFEKTLKAIQDMLAVVGSKWQLDALERLEKLKPLDVEKRMILPKEFVEILRKAREANAKAAQTMKILNNLKQIGLAFRAYHDTYKHFPPAAIYSRNGQPLLSWRVSLLPYLGQQELYRQFKLDEPWDSPHNKKLLDKMPKVYASLRGNAENPKSATFYQVFTGPTTLFDGSHGTTMTRIHDGTSNTLLFVEAAQAVPWTKPADLTYKPTGPLPKLGAESGGIPALMVDGSAHLLRPDIAPEQLRRLILPRDGLVVDYKKVFVGK